MTIFVQVQTQWRIDQGILIGFDYNALQWIFKLNKKLIKKPLEILADLQVLEAKIVETPENPHYLAKYYSTAERLNGKDYFELVN